MSRRRRTGSAAGGESPRLRRSARRGLFALIIALLLIPTAAAGGQARADLVDIEDEVMCIVCARPLSTSGGDAADDQRAVIQGFIDEGLTKEQVKDRLVAEYGKKVLVNNRSPIAAAAPVVAALVGGASVWLLLRRRRAGQAARDADGADEPGAALLPTDADPGGPLARAPVSAADEARIDAELSERG